MASTSSSSSSKALNSLFLKFLLYMSDTMDFTSPSVNNILTTSFSDASEILIPFYNLFLNSMSSVDSTSLSVLIIEFCNFLKEFGKTASTSSSSTSAAIYDKYDIFLSFRGVDTRNSFTDHLYEALRKSGITTFRDDDEIQEGHELKLEIKRSIRESRASIIVFSENFANSSWCLDELWLILEQKRKRSHFILPVFYGVDPSDVRNQRGSFMIEAKDGVEYTKWTQDNVKRWKAALTEVASLKGMVVSGYEKDFIKKIVDKVYRRLGLEIHSTPTHLTGIETRAEAINSWLRSKKHDHIVLAICGMGGSGKTTLAKHIYYSNKHAFEGSSLLEEIEKQPGGLLGVQKKLLRDISGNKNMMISNVYEGALHLEKAIQMNRVLIVVDDVNDKDTLGTLFGTKAFPAQSKIIITTRVQNVNTWYGSISCGCHVHQIELLNDPESLELLSFHAFGSKFPMKGLEGLALQLAQYCEGNPLALEVLGSSLAVGPQEQCATTNMIETWRSRINSLNSLKGDLDFKIQGILRKSFDCLPCESHKELFLHIACLFIGEYAYQVEKVLEDDWHAKSGITTLINRCLITRTRDGLQLTMHNLLQDMASKIVREESKDPAKRSRVWHEDESYCLLRKGDGSKTIEGLVVDMEYLMHGIPSEAFKTNSLVKMKNLKFLYLNCVSLSGSYENFPELKWLRWAGCNLTTIPPGLLTSCLVALYIYHGDLEEFDPPNVLNSLKILDLYNSRNLVRICNLHRLPKLEYLYLSNCISLTHICETIGDLDNLLTLRLSRCIKLWRPSSIQKSKNGEIQEQPLCSLPLSLCSMVLENNLFEMLPNHIDLNMLSSLYLNGSPNLKSLPCLPSTLEELYVDWCSSLEIITFQSPRFTLQMFGYEGCFKLCEIQGLFKLVSIKKLDEADLGHMQWIKAYQDHKVDLVGDVITRGRTFNIQMLYEYGIRSTFLQGIKDQSMTTHAYKSSSRLLSFRVPLHPKMLKIQGLYLTILYRAVCYVDNTPLFVRITNRSKGITWVYNPVVYCKPRVDGDTTWLSYWPLGNTLDAGDFVHVNFFAMNLAMAAIGYGASLVYMDVCEAGKEARCEIIQEEEVIGGDLSLFEVTKGSYYLCRVDFFKSNIPFGLFGDKMFLCTDSRRWRSHGEIATMHEEYNDLQNPYSQQLEVTLGVSFNSKSEKHKIKKAASRVDGVECVSTHKETAILTVQGRFDPQEVAMCVKDFGKMVQVLDYRFLPAQEMKKNGLLGSRGALQVRASVQSGTARSPPKGMKVRARVKIRVHKPLMKPLRRHER